MEKTIIYSASEKEMHHNAVKAMAQAAVNLELFTIPLYMTSMYSLTGMHQITGKNELYRGRWWPGTAPNATPTKLPYGGDTERLPVDLDIFGTFGDHQATNKDKMICTVPNNLIYNAIFKVFVEEMLHLQLASNLSRVLGLEETSFTHPDLVTQPLSKDTPYDPTHKSYGWHCYGNDNSVIPYIVDLKDTKQADVKVKLGPLDKNQIALFKIIELPEADAKENVVEDKRSKYFPAIPFADWTKDSTGTKDLPMFGSIGHLYKCLWEYLHIAYDDDTTQMDYILAKVDTAYPQHDLFNVQQPGHPRAEFPGFNATIFGSKSEDVLPRIKEMIDAITEQGEGGNVTDPPVPEGMVMAVAPQDQADKVALEKDYKSYSDRGCPMASSHAYARAGGDISSMDHEEIFEFVEQQMAHEEFQTWDMWHAKGNEWSGEMLYSDDYKNNKHSKANKENKNHALPDPHEVAGAMNRLKTNEDAYSIMSQASAGAIKGIITVLNTYWSTSNTGKTQFPYPSMGGSGDRMSICWAVLGKAPNIEAGVKDRPSGKTHLNHACQGLAITPIGGKPTHDSTTCADVSIYHTCKGSNDCRAEGGCGFVQQVGGGGNCGKSTKLSGAAMCGSSTYFSPPADNACGGQGGCAVPISASQLFPKPPKGGIIDMSTGTIYAQMQLHDFKVKTDMGGQITGITSEIIRKEGSCEGKSFNYSEGDSVYETAWEAYTEVCKSREEKPRDKPEPSDFRLAFPPST